MNQRAPSNHQPRQLSPRERARHAEVSATPILFRPTWAEAYASRFRRASNHRSHHASLAPPEATTHDNTDATVTLNFSAAGLAVSAASAERAARRLSDRETITCPEEAIRHIAVARIIIICETAEALRIQANLTEGSARYLLN